MGTRRLSIFQFPKVESVNAEDDHCLVQHPSPWTAQTSYIPEYHHLQCQ